MFVRVSELTQVCVCVCEMVVGSFLARALFPCSQACKPLTSLASPSPSCLLNAARVRWVYSLGLSVGFSLSLFLSFLREACFSSRKMSVELQVVVVVAAAALS